MMSAEIAAIFLNHSKQLFNTATKTRTLIKLHAINGQRAYYNQRRNFSLGSCSQMRYVQFKVNEGPRRLGAQMCAGGDIFDISAVDSSIPNSLVQFLSADSSVHDKAKRIIATGCSLHHYADVTLLPPVTKPDKVACVGLNYSGHCDEQNIPYPDTPMIFSKFSSTLIGANDNIVMPTLSNKVDWEVELAVVIGKEGKNIPRDQAYDHIFGYTIAQDISARDWQKSRNNGQFLLGKSMDTFCPLGPAVVSKDVIENPHDLEIECWVNGELKQCASTKELIFKIDFLVSYLSQLVTLYPGDLILTGTPAGVGMYRNPPEYLKKGDVVESRIEAIGRIKNTVV